MQTAIDFTPDDQAHVDKEGVIRLLSNTFRDHEDGLPEWVKNSSDMYRRKDKERSQSVIVLLFRNRRGDDPSAIGCLDFGGMSVSDIEDKFRRWGDPEASGSKKNNRVLGGHGNGGKAYMMRMFEERAFLHTLLDGRASKYGFYNQGAEVKSGYFPSPEEGGGRPVTDPDDELANALSYFQISIGDLPSLARKAWEESQGFTLAAGIGAKNCSSRLPVKSWMDHLRSHPQMVQVLKMNRIYAFSNGEGVEGALPLKFEPIPPHPSSQDPRKISIPQVLIDPSTDVEVETGATNGESYLELKTSEAKMTGKKLKHRHRIFGWATEGRSTGYWEVPELSSAAYAKHIYGDIYLQELSSYEQNARREHTNSSLIRALKRWMGEEISSYAAEFSKFEAMQATQEQRDELTRLNNYLNQWTSSFLDDQYGGIGDDDEGGTGRGKSPRPPKGNPAKIEIELTHKFAGQGTTLKPRVKFLDADNERVRAVPHSFFISDESVVSESPQGKITTHAPGESEIFVSCAGSDIKSNVVSIEVLDIAQIELAPLEVEIEQGSKKPISASVITSDGRELTGVYLAWVEGDDHIASVGSSGMVYGRQEGKTTVAAHDDKTIAEKAVQVEIVEGEMKEDGGDGRPRILLSEIDMDPLGGKPPQFSADEPPIFQRPWDVEANIWWINMSSPLARRYIDTAKGGGARSREWRVYHVERYIEAISKIILSYEFENEETTFNIMSRRLDEQATEMQARVIESLSEFLDEGITPSIE